ncbi:MAG: metallophosphoesterase [Betaproteobacteria bacterium]
MNLCLFSDLHLEIAPWEPPPGAKDADVVVLAGDIHRHTHGIDWAREHFSQPVVYVAGNHEYYRAHLGLLDEMRRQAVDSNVHVLERDVLVVGGVRFLGCTLWSDFSLHGEGDAMIQARADAKKGIRDFSVIGAHGGALLEPEDIARIHRTSVGWLRDKLAEPFAGKTVVVTHFGPHRGCIPERFMGSAWSPYFVSDLAPLMQAGGVDVWMHGHTHWSTDFSAGGACRVISNQRGYPGEAETTGFRADLVVRV